MNIFSNLRLNGNSITGAIVDTSKIGTGWSGTTATAAGAGAIRYNSSEGRLEYSTGTGEWIGVGASEATNNNVNGSFGIYSTDSWSDSTAAKIRVAVDADGTNTPGANFRCQIKGNGKGSISFTGKSPSSASSAKTVSTVIVKVLYANINVTASNNGYDYVFKHSLGTQNLLINTYFAEVKDGGGNYTFNLIQCDIEIQDENNIVVKLRGNVPAGILKVVLYGGAMGEALGGAFDNETAVQVNTRQVSDTNGTYSNSGDTGTISPISKT